MAEFTMSHVNYISIFLIAEPHAMQLTKNELSNELFPLLFAAANEISFGHKF